MKILILRKGSFNFQTNYRIVRQISGPSKINFGTFQGGPRPPLVPFFVALMIELITTPATTTKKSKINFPKNDCETLCDEPYNIALCSNECRMNGRLNTIYNICTQFLEYEKISENHSSNIHTALRIKFHHSWISIATNIRLIRIKEPK